MSGTYQGLSAICWLTHDQRCTELWDTESPSTHRYSRTYVLKKKKKIVCSLIIRYELGIYICTLYREQ